MNATKYDICIWGSAILANINIENNFGIFWACLLVAFFIKEQLK